jgi:murein DD-endopeptidase MepM/ murein hydrolase activator NlpD
MRRFVLASLLLAACQPPLTPLVSAPTPASAPASAPAPAVAPASARELTTPAATPAERPSLAIVRPAKDFPDQRLLRSRQLMVPVAGKTILDVDDTFDHARSGERVHRAVDVLAPRGTPVVATDAGTVLAIKQNALGGKVVYCTDPSGQLVYYYAHLDRYADGLAEGQRLRQGDVIGYVGTTGNAPANVPHLHFQVMRLDNPSRYWEGTPLDARPYFIRDGERTGGQSAGGR